MVDLSAERARPAHALGAPHDLSGGTMLRHALVAALGAAALAVGGSAAAVPTTAAPAGDGPTDRLTERLADRGGYWYDTPPDGRYTAGPPYRFVTSIMTDNVEPMKNAAVIGRTKHGYRYISGQQHNRLRVTMTDNGKIRFADTGTRKLKRVAKGCKRVKAGKGVAAVCAMPSATRARPVLLEVWPRLGNDHVDGSTLPATIAMSVLGDRGNENVRFGRGPDFFNGFTGVDRVSGGAGKDWIRLGQDRDFAYGGPGADQIIGTDGRDQIKGGGGADRLDGNNHDDRLVGGAGRDRINCGAHRDTAIVERGDRRTQCENTVRR
ncbi:calcium-binding protein [Nocardioides sp. TF02-7]|uniref:calcium-binding protein n=1 Tax=Nocardioides sp. TF02-7 TaxID=2917724 RepID=UPI001F05D7A1|nr:calcium-binding protein [Nocardioides sp. TF02-7]UMG93466.1 hypothetical protein MF408_04370 [Nocardioides sp. TF02-7]